MNDDDSRARDYIHIYGYKYETRHAEEETEQNCAFSLDGTTLTIHLTADSMFIHREKAASPDYIRLHSWRIRLRVRARVSDVYSTRWLKYAFWKTGEINFACTRLILLAVQVESSARFSEGVRVKIS